MPTVRGSFEGAQRLPFVNARIVLPSLGVAGVIPFLVDTGADNTTIHWHDRRLLVARDGEPLAPDAAFLERTSASGISLTPIDYGIEDAVLVFGTESGSTLTTDVRAQIELSPQRGVVPSLLGRDVLEEARLDFNMPADELVLEWALA